MASTIGMRRLTVADQGLLARATLENLNWAEERFTERDLAARPDLHLYTLLVAERGDFGLVAEAARTPVGVVWAQVRDAAHPGYGFLDEATPEVSIWVRQDLRGRGVGRALLRAAIREAAGRGYPRVSLSVEAGNPARRLYESEGFAAVPGCEDAGVMSRTSRPAAPGRRARADHGGAVR